MRRRNCNLELRLFPSSDATHHPRFPLTKMEEEDQAISETPNQNLQKLTIFYDGKMCSSDVTELQARWILMVASKERVAKTPNLNGWSEPWSPKNASKVALNSPITPTPSTGLSMKRSLQRFLQKRKTRIQQASPYNH